MEPMRSTGTGISQRRRVEAVVDTLANIYREDESLAELAHDARNMVTALSLYCDLLEEPGVLSTVNRHYGSELRLVTEASSRLVEKLSRLALEKTNRPAPQALSRIHGRLFPQGFEIAASIPNDSADLRDRDDLWGEDLIENLREEILADRNLLAAIAGPTVTLTLDPRGGALPVAMTSEDLTQLLVNLVKNAAESMLAAGTVEIALFEPSWEPSQVSAGGRTVVLAVEDNGPGISAEALETVFEPGYTTKPDGAAKGNWPTRHQGLGLSIVRSTVEAAGGEIHAEAGSQGGARFVIELPVRTR